jgi:hypothetical protein
MEKILEACQACKNKTNPDASACSGCGHAVTPETIEMGKRYQKKIRILTLSFFMIFFTPFGLFLISDSMSNGEMLAGCDHCEIALRVGILLITFVGFGFVVYLLFVKKK